MNVQGFGDGSEGVEVVKKKIPAIGYSRQQENA